MKLKKLSALFLSAALCVCGTGIFSSCGKKNNEEKPREEESVTVREAGNFITLSAVDSYHKKAVNDSGMSGTGGRIHLHSAAAADMVKDDGNKFTFDAGHAEKLGEFHVWNYNAAGNTGTGLKEISVYLSEDNVTYEKFGDFVLARASGEEGIAATDLEDGSYIDFGGKSARYIRIEAKSNYGGNGYGLSEVRLFRYKQPIREGENISASPIERYINGKWSAKAEDYNLTNGAGLSFPVTENSVHDNDPAHMLTKDASAIGFTLDLKGEYPVNKVAIWNYNDPDHLDYGLNRIRVRVSDDSNSWKAMGTYDLQKAEGDEKMAPSLVADLGNVQAHYVQIEIISNYGGEMAGLSAAEAFLGDGWYCDAAPDYTAMLSSYSGWAGADGIYTVNLDGKDYDETRKEEDKKTFFVFSDTIVSEVDPVTKLRKTVYMPNNTSALLTGGKASVKNISFVYPSNTKECANIRPDPLESSTANAKKHKYYWLGDTFVVGEKLYVYALKIDTVDPAETGYSFAQTGVDLACYDIVNGEVDYSSLRLINDTQGRLCDVSDKSSRFYFGGAVFQSTESAGAINPDGYTYVYGYNDVHNKGRKLIAARVKGSVEDFSSYEYLASDGSWTNSVPSEFMYLADDVAPECSVSQIQTGENRGKFIFVNSHITNSPTIKASVSDAPYHKFTDKTTIFSYDDCTALPGTGNNTYNAKAHPALSSANELIVSYNINGNDAFTYADIYRPRFLRLAVVAKGNK